MSVTARRVDVGSVVGVGVVGLDAEVGGDHGRVGADLFGGADGDQPAEVEDDDLVAHAHHEVHVVLDDEDRHAPVVGQPADDPGQLDALDRAQAGRRLVEQQHARMHRHRPGDRQQPPLAVRQVADLAVEVLVELELRRSPARPAARTSG